ncbi:MAG TPA: hypothetical protein VNZ58_15015, partial [Thermomicrobiales bacterium]|nr:hypothetical protein [Thermomicrobiales bacterium]
NDGATGQGGLRKRFVNGSHNLTHWRGISVRGTILWQDRLPFSSGFAGGSFAPLSSATTVSCRVRRTGSCGRFSHSEVETGHKSRFSGVQ